MVRTFSRRLLPGLLLFLLAAAGHAAENPRVRLQTTQGDITLELFAEQAPATVANFLAYVDDGFFNGTVFHRVIAGFMAQGGGFTASLERKQTRDAIANEADNGLPNLAGTVAMARTGNPHSATSQFFINLADNDFLNHRDKGAGWGYCVFGRVIEGGDTMRRIEALPTGGGGPFAGDVPMPAVVIVDAQRVPKAEP